MHACQNLLDGCLVLSSPFEKGPDRGGDHFEPDHEQVAVRCLSRNDILEYLRDLTIFPQGQDAQFREAVERNGDQGGDEQIMPEGL